MSDQAETLRKLGGRVVCLRPRRERTIAVTGGKGGVGKSTVSVNLAVAYAAIGAEVLLVDGDLGMADLNLLLGVAPDKSLAEVLLGDPIEDVLVETHGIHLLPALNGSDALADLDDASQAALFAAVNGLESRFDTIVVDVAAGIGRTAAGFAGAVSEPVVVATPEPLSLADSYACLKVLSLRYGVTHAYIAPNRVRSPAEADDVVGRLGALVTRFLGVSLSPLPPIPFDPAVAEAAAAGVPLVTYRPDCPASRAIRQIARRLDALAVPDQREGGGRLRWTETAPRFDSERSEP